MRNQNEKNLDPRSQLKKNRDKMWATLVLRFADLYVNELMSRNQVCTALMNSGMYDGLFASRQSLYNGLGRALREVSRLERYHPEEIGKARQILPIIDDLFDHHTDRFSGLTKSARKRLIKQHLMIQKQHERD